MNTSLVVVEPMSIPKERLLCSIVSVLSANAGRSTLRQHDSDRFLRRQQPPAGKRNDGFSVDIIKTLLFL